VAYNPSTSTVVGSYVGIDSIIGEGGWNTRLAPSANDGTMATGADVACGWTRGPSASSWTRFLRPNDNYDMTNDDWMASAGGGTYDIDICYSDPTVSYMMGCTWLFKSVNGVVTRTNYPQDTSYDSNDFSTKMIGKSLAIDPANANVVWVGINDIRYTVDGGTNWTTVSTGTLPAPITLYWTNFNTRTGSMPVGATITGGTSGATAVLFNDACDTGTSGGFPNGVIYVKSITGTFVHGEDIKISGVTVAKIEIYDGAFRSLGRRRYNIAFDRSSTVTGGRTQGIYIYIPGYGVYRSTNAGASWSLMAGTSTFTPGSMKVSPLNGYVHLAGWAGGLDAAGIANTYRRWNGSTWSAPGATFKTTAISPHNAGHLYGIDAGGGTYFSSDSGGTWTSQALSTVTPVNIGWIANTDNYFKSNGDIEFQKNINRLWMADGIGMAYVDNPPTNGSSINWLEAGAGVENMISGMMGVTPNGTLIGGVHDREGFVIPKAQIGLAYPARPAITSSFGHGGSFDWAPEDPNFIVGCNYVPNDNSQSIGGYSTDNGVTWHAMPGSIISQHGGIGAGNIIALSKTVFVQRCQANGPVIWTKDSGLTWTTLSYGGGSNRGMPLYYATARFLVRDPYTANRFYLYQPDDDVSNSDPNIVASRGCWQFDYNTGTQTMSVTRKRSTWITGPVDYFHGQLVPYGPGKWLFTSGDGASGVRYSADSMATWTDVVATDPVFGTGTMGMLLGLACGPGISPASPPAVLVYGARSQTAPHYESWGAWLSVDGMVNWKRIAQFPDNYWGTLWNWAADPNEFGLFYFGGSQGWGRLKYTDSRLQT